MNQVAAFVQAVSTPTSVPREQRSAERRSCKLEAVSVPMDAPETLCWGATVRNISAGGIGLSLCYPFKPGTYLVINLESADCPRSLLGRVVHVADQADGAWFLGCELVEQLDSGVVEKMA